MDYFFSIIIPTRDRPEFIRESLKYISLQSYKNFEVIVSDNFSSESLSCETYFKQAMIPNSKYIRPDKELGMVENWNFALTAAKGDYFIYLTDKMFLLPNTLSRLNKALSESKADLVNWVDDIFAPESNVDYFGKGYYLKATSLVPSDQSYLEYHPLSELSKKGIAQISRYRQDKSTYARGKICFGAYSKELIHRIISKYNQLFYNICPDYTSMILALTESRRAIELKDPGIVHINTNISNGGQVALKDDFALGYLNSLEDTEGILKSMMIKDLYSSLHNMVSHDYLSLKTKFNLPFEFSLTNWVMHIYEDLYLRPRIWSSIFKEFEQKGFFIEFIENLSEGEKKEVNRLINHTKSFYLEKPSLEVQQSQIHNEGGLIKKAFRFIIPYGIIDIYRKKQIINSRASEGYTTSLEQAIV